MLTYLIDAYNVMHHHSRMRERMRSDFNGARERFIAMVAGFASGGKNEFVVVCDGKGEEMPPPGPRLRIVFADAGKSADRKIKDFIDRAKNPKTCVIVSSDREVEAYGRMSLCRTMDAGEFIRMIEGRSAGETSEKPESESVFEKEEWLRIFGGKNKKSK